MNDASTCASKAVFKEMYETREYLKRGNRGAHDNCHGLQSRYPTCDDPFWSLWKLIFCYMLGHYVDQRQRSVTYIRKDSSQPLNRQLFRLWSLGLHLGTLLVDFETLNVRRVGLLRAENASGLEDHLLEARE